MDYRRDVCCRLPLSAVVCMWDAMWYYSGEVLRPISRVWDPSSIMYDRYLWRGEGKMCLGPFLGPSQSNAKTPFEILPCLSCLRRN